MADVWNIVHGYDYPYDNEFISEEEFIYDSLKNRPLFDILTTTNIKMLHLKDEGESLWDDPDEEFIKIVTTGEGGSEDVEEGSSETSYDSEESDES